MKRNILLISCAVFFMLFICSEAGADLMVVDIDPGINLIADLDTNPQRLLNSDEKGEEEWLEGLLGLSYNDSSIVYISKNETGSLGGEPAKWLYAVLKYGVGKPLPDNPDHWAIMDDGDGILSLGGISGLPDIDRLSHVTYFGESMHTPVPATLYLLGTGIVGLFGIRRRLKK